VTAVRFYLVRHGAAEGKHPDGDAARHLTAAGREAFARHARAVAPSLSVARIATSPFVRARETADLLAAATGAATEDAPELASGASTGRQLLALGRCLGAGAALVGHNPEIAQALSLAAGRQQEVPPGSIACVEDTAEGWSLVWLRSPR
jgi:phosphohistidine phosphatase